MGSWSDSFIVSKTNAAITRKCPFCPATVLDDLGRDINFIVHCGSPILEHRNNWDWANYVTTLNHI